MQVKGSVVKSVSEFVKSEHSSGFEAWLKKLPQASHSIYTKPILATDWYPVDEGVIIPTRLISDLFFSDPKKAAWASGRYSAHTALTGIYKVFVLISTPAFMMSTARKILAAFYDPTSLEVVRSDSKSMCIHITQMPKPDLVLEHRIGGWTERALEICGCKQLKIKITKSMAAGDAYTEYDISWT